MTAGASACRTGSNAGSGVKDLAVDDGAGTRLLYVKGNLVCSARCDQAQYESVKAQIIAKTLSHADGTAKLRASCVPEASLAKNMMPGSAAFKAAVSAGKLFEATNANLSYKATLEAMKGAACPGPDEADIVLVGADDVVTPIDGGTTGAPANSDASTQPMRGKCGVELACPEIFAFADLGCLAKDAGGKTFEALTPGNNTCATNGLVAQVCAASLKPSDFKVTCFTKKRPGGDDPLAAPDGTVATPITVSDCGGTFACAQFVDNVSMGCAAKAPDGQVFKDLSPGNNACASLGIRSQICSAGLKPADVKAVCFAKKPTDVLAPPAGATAAAVTLPPCDSGPMACAQFLDRTSLGCAAKAPNGATFKEMTAGNNSCAVLGLQAQVCKAGVDPASVSAVCFAKRRLSQDPATSGGVP